MTDGGSPRILRRIVRSCWMTRGEPGQAHGRRYQEALIRTLRSGETVSSSRTLIALCYLCYLVEFRHPFESETSDTIVYSFDSDLAAFTKGITINVIQTKGSKLISYGRTHIPVRNSEECDEGWYPILHQNSKTKATEHLGDLRLKLKYEEQIVLPLPNYSVVLEVTRHDSLAFAFWAPSDFVEMMYGTEQTNLCFVADLALGPPQFPREQCYIETGRARSRLGRIR